MRSFLKNIAASVWNFFTSNNSVKYLFVMGHPRSGSSLLMHILTSNPEVVGFGEYLTKYHNLRSLQKAEFDIRRKSSSLFKRCHYVANQVNHASITPNIKLLSSEGIRLIFLFRRPEETLSSIFLLSADKKITLSQEDITSVYTERLKYQLQVLKQIPKKNWIVIKYEELIETPNKELNKISRFLQLKEPLNSNYKLQKYTQIWGDPSKNIKHGQVFKPNSQVIPFDEKLNLRANKAYNKLIDFMKEQPS